MSYMSSSHVNCPICLGKNKPEFVQKPRRGDKQTSANLHTHLQILGKHKTI